MTLEAFTLGTLPVTRWKNGGGTTREIALWPPESGLDRFLWRVSVATLATSGPFSVFQGIDRRIMVLAGEGVRLRSDDGTLDHRLDERHRPFAFAGDLAIEGELIGGESSDLNVMSRRGRGEAELRVEHEPTTLPLAACGVLLCLAGSWRVDGHGLCEDEGLRWLDAPLAPSRLVPGGPGAAIAVATWQPAATS